MNKNIKIGLIGYSSGGRIYNAPIIQSVSGLEIIKIFERKDENIKLANKNFPNALVVSDLEQIFKDDNIDLVVIAVPTHLHYKLAYEALNNNKNVVVEKPFTVTSKEADSLIKFAKEKTNY